MKLPKRDLATEVAKHFHGTAAYRIELALRLGQEAVDTFLASLPVGTTRARAVELLRRNKHRGRRRSRVMDEPRAELRSRRSK